MKKVLTMAAAFLFVLSFSQLSFAHKGPAKLTVDGTTKITTQEAHKMFKEGVLFIDSRRANTILPNEKILNAVNLSTRYKLSEASLLEVMKKTDKAVFYCHGVDCPASGAGLKRAVSWGFTNLYYYREGIAGWKKAGFPVE